MFWHNEFWKKNAKQSLYKAIFLRMFSCKQGQTSCNNITKKMFWWIIFVIITKIVTKNNCSKELFCNHFGQEGTQCRQSPQIPTKPLQNPETHHYKTSTKPPEQNLYKTHHYKTSTPTHHYKTSTKPPAHHYKTSTKPPAHHYKTSTKLPSPQNLYKTPKTLQNKGFGGFCRGFLCDTQKTSTKPSEPLIL